MDKEIKNIFISHAHEDDSKLIRLKELANRNGLEMRDSSITSENPNAANSSDYIKQGILAPHIKWASVLVVYISPHTKGSKWVDWEIEYAHKNGKRIVGIWERGSSQCELPDAIDKYGDALVCWNGDNIVDAINGSSDEWCAPGKAEKAYRDIKRHSC